LNTHSAKVHDSTAQAVARKVLIKASAAKLPASRAEPALRAAMALPDSDPKLIGQLAENLIYTSAVEIANVPEYSSDEAHTTAVNEIIASDPMLLAAAESRNPELIARAIQIGHRIAKASATEAQGQQLAQRVKDLEAREAKLKQQESELEQERAKLTRGRGTVAGGAAGGAAKQGTGSMAETVDEVFSSLNL